MDDGQETTVNNELPFYGDHRFIAMLVIVILISTALVVISILMYSSSGAAQLDLSRPGYKDVRTKVIKQDDSLLTFSNIGTMNQTIIDDFQELYAQQSVNAKAVDAFGGDPLNATALWPITISE